MRSCETRFSGRTVRLAIFGSIAGFLSLALVVTNLLSMAIAGLRWRRRSGGGATGGAKPGVTIIRPLCNVEEFSRETLAANFAIDWPSYEIIFCVQKSTDPVIPLVREIMTRHPSVRARLLIGDDPITANPKLNNCIKGWRVARYRWIAIADSNALLPRDYLKRMMGAWRADSGLVSSMPLGTRPASFAAHVECAFLNTFQARWQYAAEAVGQGFAQGKNMLWRKDILDRAGGLPALGEEPAEDAASTRLVRAQGLQVHLVDMPFEQPLGRRRIKDVWLRQTRWARLRRATFPAQFLPEILTGAVAPIGLAIVAALALDIDPVLTGSAVAAVLYGAELLLAMRAGVLGWRMPVAMVLRDLAIPAIYFDAWLIDSFTWHGHAMSVVKTDDVLLRQSPT